MYTMQLYQRSKQKQVSSSYVTTPRKLMGVPSTMSLERNCINEGPDNGFVRISTICDVEGI